MPCLLQTAPVFGLSRGSLPEYGHSPLVECLHSSLDRTCACSAVIAPAPLLSHSGLRFVLTCVAAYSCLLMGVLCCSFTFALLSEWNWKFKCREKGVGWVARGFRVQGRERRAYYLMILYICGFAFAFTFSLHLLMQQF